MCIGDVYRRGASTLSSTRYPSQVDMTSLDGSVEWWRDVYRRREYLGWREERGV